MCYCQDFLKKCLRNHVTAESVPTFKPHLCNLFKILMPLLQSSGSVQRLANTCVFAEEGLSVVFYPVQYLNKHKVN